MKTIRVIGIGAGDPDYLTLQAVKAMNLTDVFFLLDKGPLKAGLIDVRRALCAQHVARRAHRFVNVASPERRPDGGDYPGAVEDLNRHKQALFAELIGQHLGPDECGAFLVWGDPSLYDSTLRILDAVLASATVPFEVTVIPGITSVQALAARHKITLNEIGGSVEITTGRRVAASQAGSRVVMLDAREAFTGLDPDLHIYWGAYLGMPQEILISGRLGDVAEQICQVRRDARVENGWIMDTWLVRPPEGRAEVEETSGYTPP